MSDKLYTVDNGIVTVTQTLGRGKMSAYFGREFKTSLKLEEGVLTINYLDYLDNVQTDYEDTIVVSINDVETEVAIQCGIGTLEVDVDTVVNTEIVTVVENIDNGTLHIAATDVTVVDDIAEMQLKLDGLQEQNLILMDAMATIFETILGGV